MIARALFAVILVSFFLKDVAHAFTETAKGELAESKDGSLFSLIEDKLEVKIGEYVTYVTKYLADYNDKHLGASQVGRFLHYDEIKPKLELETGRSKPAAAARMKKMAMAMMPLVFHVGATSTWMVLTAIMAAKGVMIGLALLVFKIAVSSAKLAAFFTHWKSKHDDHHHGWSYSPPHEYHGHDRSFSNIEPIIHSHHESAHPHYESAHPHHESTHHEPAHHSDWHSYSPEWTPNDIPNDYHTLPTGSEYKDIEGDKHSEYIGPYLHAEDRNKKIAEKKKFT